MADRNVDDILYRAIDLYESGIHGCDGSFAADLAEGQVDGSLSPKSQRQAVGDQILQLLGEAAVSIDQQCQLDVKGLRDQSTRRDNVLQTTVDRDKAVVSKRRFAGSFVHDQRISVGDRIGDYRLVEMIGEGGMGTVFLAERQGPFCEKVAIKLIRSHLCSGESLARFEAERQAIALMDHPNIARLLGAGVSGPGQPYFVMEWLPGTSITDHCFERDLPIQARLQLFCQLCDAIAHAHGRNVVHRDVKPSNALVIDQQGVDMVKVIDFGLAKSTIEQMPLTDRTLFTQVGAVLGTPAYMSPEQACRNGLGIDHRSDIYSLGVILYELISGTTPIPRSEIETDPFDVLVRKIREDVPVRPSRLIRKAGGRPASCPRALDAIVMKAIEKDRVDRYGSVGDLACDIERYLQGRRVDAKLPRRSWKQVWMRTRRCGD
ncbi:MAG: serine/threonine-protein kinase [Rubripirellula sp.]